MISELTFVRSLQACTKRRAILSVLQHPRLAGDANLSEEAKKTEASRLVNEVWQSCWNDTRPFDEVSRNGWHGFPEQYPIVDNSFVLCNLR